MRLTSVFGFVQTASLFAGKSGSKSKGEYVLVQCHSVATGYQVEIILDLVFSLIFCVTVCVVELLSGCLNLQYLSYL